MTDEADKVAVAAEGVDGGLARLAEVLRASLYEDALTIEDGYRLFDRSPLETTLVKLLATMRNAPPAFIERARYQPSAHGTIIHAASDVLWTWQAIISQYLGEEPK